jgi:hypothetical protein
MLLLLVFIPLVMVPPAYRELVYHTPDGIYNEHGRIGEGSYPVWCDGTLAYVLDGDIHWGERITNTPEWESHLSCASGVLVYERGNGVWEYRDGVHTKRYDGYRPSISADGRIAYEKDRYIWVDDLRLTHGDDPAWGPKGLYYTNGQIMWWDGVLTHNLRWYGSQPCWTPEGIYYHCVGGLCLGTKLVFPGGEYPSY